MGRLPLAASFFLVAALVLAGCSTGFKPGDKGTSQASVPPAGLIKAPTNGVVQSNSAGNVTIAVRWSGAQGTSLVFDVTMDTHSVDLDAYDLGRLAVLRDDLGNEVRATSWNAPPGGHHRSGKLAFPPPDAVKKGQAGYVELVIRDVAGVAERVLRWQL